jgi:hypothetical protein
VSGRIRESASAGSRTDGWDTPTSGEMASNGTDPEAESNQAANGGAVIRSLGDTGNNQGGSIREEDLSMDAIGPSARCQAVITLLGVHS